MAFLDLSRFLGADPKSIATIPFVPRLDSQPLPVPEETYFRVVLVQMALRARTRVFTERYPVVHAQTEFSVLGGSSQRSAVISPEVPGQQGVGQLGNVLVRNQDLTGHVVFRGGAIKLALGLYSAPGDDWANQLFDLARAVAKVSDAIPLESALAIAQPIKHAFDELSGSGKLILELGLKIDLTSSELLDHAFLAILALPEPSLDTSRLSVQGSSLYYEERPLEATDFILLRTDFACERDDLPRLSISKRAADLTRSIAESLAGAALGGDGNAVDAEIVAKYQSFVPHVFASDALTFLDRERIIAGVRRRIGDLRRAFQPAADMVLRSSGARAEPRVLVDEASRARPDLFGVPLAEAPPAGSRPMTVAEAMKPL